MGKGITTKLKDILCDLTDEVHYIFETPLDNAFVVATYILSSKSLPYFSNLSEEANNTISSIYNTFKKIQYTPYEMRRAFSEAYLMSLRDVKDYTVKVTLELPLLYFRMIVDLLASKTEYEHITILNASANIGTLSLALAMSENINENDLYVTVNNEEEVRIAENLRNLSGYTYPIQDTLPSLSFRADIIVSDPFLRTPEDILIFFEDYMEYLNTNGFFVVALPTDYIRSRVFSDSLEDHNLVLLGLIEYPKDLLEGLIESSIVILERKTATNKEFFHVSMPSIKDIEQNIKIMDEIKKYISEYLGDK